jgi:hypothetical protein
MTLEIQSTDRTTTFLESSTLLLLLEGCDVLSISCLAVALRDRVGTSDIGAEILLSDTAAEVENALLCMLIPTCARALLI